MEPPANLSSPYTKPARSHGPLFQTRNPRHSTNRGIRRRKSNATPSKIDVSDRLISTFANKSPNLILQPNDPSYDLTKPPPDLGSGRVPRKVCGDWSSKLKLLRHVTHGPLLALRFVSDYSNHFGGYKAKVAMENGECLCCDASQCLHLFPLHLPFFHAALTTARLSLSKSLSSSSFLFMFSREVSPGFTCSFSVFCFCFVFELFSQQK